jgi:alpha-beta hydrolase superfamily lysophospholipase
MKTSTFRFKDHDGLEIFVYRWAPEEKVKAVVQIAHGMAEYAARYARAAEALTLAGYSVYASDHRGHGQSAQGPDKLGHLGPGGWASLLRDLRQLTGIIVKENAGVPLFQLGHSMGSFLAQQYIQQGSNELKGVILSGTNGKESSVGLALGRTIAKIAAKRQGPNARGEIVHGLVFGAYNRQFAPAKSEFDWLSRDQAEVQKYVSDPLCGFVCPNSFFVELLTALSSLWKPANEAQIRKDLPVYLLSGMRDPVGKNGKGVIALYERYVKLGMQDVTIKLYPDGRHEMFNETNRQEVYRDLIQWLDTRSR